MSSPENLEQVSPEALAELRELLTQKAADLFALCDQEEKGFVTKRDMQRMRSELPLQPEQLESVFDTLDADQNGYLTLEEFTEGFNQFLGIEGHLWPEGSEEGLDSKGDDPSGMDSCQALLDDLEPKGDERDEEEEFNDVLSELGLLGLIEDDRALRSMWLNLKRDNDPALVSNFEDFLSKLSVDLGKKSSDQESLENNLRSRQLLQEEHIQHLYEEMEHQIGREKKKIQEDEERKEQKMREELETTLDLKDQQLMDVMQKMEHYQNQLEQVKKAVPDMKVENVHLSKERDRLQSDLERQRILMKDLQDQMEELRNQTQTERRTRAKAAFTVSENIAQEREGLVNQLDFMKRLNNKMFDDQDECVQAERSSSQGHAKDDASIGGELEMELEPRATQDNGRQQCSDRAALDLRESSAPLVHGRHYNEAPLLPLSNAPPNDVEYDDEFFDKSPAYDCRFDRGIPPAHKRLTKRRPRFGRFHSAGNAAGDNISLMDELAEIGKVDMIGSDPNGPSGSGEDDGDSVNVSSRQRLRGRYAQQIQDFRSHRPNSVPDCRYQSSLGAYHANHPTEAHYEDSSLTSGPGPQSYGESEWTSFNTRCSDFVGQRAPLHYVEPLSQMAPAIERQEVLRNPERVYKVIFIGDSSVGKSSLITRFSSGHFRAGLKSTIGVDFHTRSILVEGQSVCLQCWDTAGQERYRAITRQYFRKADAVIAVYDITSERSFLNARQWLDSAMDGTDEALLQVLGNKLDLAQDDLLRKVRKNEGMRLAEQYGTLFGEVSAANGNNVEATLTDLAKALLQREDQNMQNALNLVLHEEPKKKKGCCK